MAYSCCLRGIQWDVEPKGSETTLGGRPCYVSGGTQEKAIMIIHDLYGWSFPNIRILADHYAEEVHATVYVPDFFGGERKSVEIINTPSRWGELDLPAFLQKNTKEIRYPEMLECAKLIRSRHSRTGCIGFCFGGWGAFRLGARDVGLFDCVATAHPTHLTEEEISSIGVPVQIMAPEHDPQFTAELKTFSLQTIPTLNVPFDYQVFPGLTHGFATRGDPENDAERKGMERAKNAAVHWFRQWLDDL